MKPEQQRIAIAKACGKGHRKVKGMEALMLGVKIGSYVQVTDAPDYLNDLNAMRKAEASQNANPSFWQHYWAKLRHVVEASRRPHLTADVDVGCATAAQRAEAFLRTLNLWKP